jgi:enoyl-CoA hydratase
VTPALVSLDVADAVATVTMRRPPVNAMSRRFVDELRAHVETAASDPRVRVVVVTSAVPRMFSGGADITELEGLDTAGCAAFIARGHDLFDRFATIAQPIVASVNGVCVGGGMELAMACDLRLAAASARFAQPEVHLGVISGWGGTQRLPRLVGKTRGLELLYLGEPIDSARALAIGLVNRVVPDDALGAETTALARTLASRSPVALAKIKTAVERGLTRPLAEGLREEAAAYVEAYGDGDAKEGIRAFLEKRPARFGS